MPVQEFRKSVGQHMIEPLLAKVHYKPGDKVMFGITFKGTGIIIDPEASAWDIWKRVHDIVKAESNQPDEFPEFTEVPLQGQLW